MSSAWVAALVLACYLPVLRAETTTTPAPSPVLRALRAETITTPAPSTPTIEFSELCKDWLKMGFFRLADAYINQIARKDQEDAILVVNCHYLSSPFPSLIEINRVVMMLCLVILVSISGPVPTMLVTL
jgi:hypothetical protein